MVKYYSARRNEEPLLGELTIGVPVQTQRLSALRLANATVTFFILSAHDLAQQYGVTHSWPWDFSTDDLRRPPPSSS